MANPRVVEIGTSEYKKLEAVAAMLEAISPNGATYEVSDCYFDLGQNWVWTTIIRCGYVESQVLTPREWEEILMAETPTELANATENIRRAKYFMDK